MDEGCLSFPGLWLKVNRPEVIEVEYEDVHGEKTTAMMYGLEAKYSYTNMTTWKVKTLQIEYLK